MRNGDSSDEGSDKAVASSSSVLVLNPPLRAGRVRTTQVDWRPEAHPRNIPNSWGLSLVFVSAWLSSAHDEQIVYGAERYGSLRAIEYHVYQLDTPTH